jgi:hypothetical protein
VPLYRLINLGERVGRMFGEEDTIGPHHTHPMSSAEKRRGKRKNESGGLQRIAEKLSGLDRSWADRTQGFPLGYIIPLARLTRERARFGLRAAVARSHRVSSPVGQFSREPNTSS